MGKILEFEGTTKEAEKYYNEDEKLNIITEILNDTVQKLNDTGVISAGEIILWVHTDKTEGFVSARAGLQSLESQTMFLADFISNSVRSEIASRAEKIGKLAPDEKQLSEEDKDKVKDTKEDKADDGEDGGKTE